MSIEIVIAGSSEPYRKAAPVARILGISPKTLADWALHYPAFPHLRIPGGIRVRVSEVEKWLQQELPNFKKARSK